MSETLWRSARLVYRGLIDSDKEMLDAMDNNAEGYLQASPWLPVPRNKTTYEGAMEFYNKKCLMHAVVCLPAPEPSETSATPQAESTTSSTNTPTPAPKPIPIGMVTLFGGPPELAHHRRSEIGIQLHPDHRSKGYGTEVLQWVLRWGFRRANLHRIDINAFGWNERAIRLYERVGFVREGVQREGFWHDGEYVDGVSLGMLDREWKEKYGDVQEKELRGVES